jgi:hypothetical protein
MKRKHLKELDVDGRIILKWIIKTLGDRVWFKVLSSVHYDICMQSKYTRAKNKYFCSPSSLSVRPEAAHPVEL